MVDVFGSMNGGLFFAKVNTAGLFLGVLWSLSHYLYPTGST